MQNAEFILDLSIKTNNNNNTLKLDTLFDINILFHYNYTTQYSHYFQGNWVFLANCHLSLSWMPQLDKLVEQLQIEEPHEDFRLWLSSSPHPDFPISILQAGIKMTTEPPKVGIEYNSRSYLGTEIS